MQVASDENADGALSVALALVSDSHNISHCAPDQVYHYERESVNNRIQWLSHFFRFYKYQKQFQVFSSSKFHTRDCQNTIWFPSKNTRVDYLVTSHVDYIAGTGAVDNASGLAIMAAVAECCASQKISNVAFVAFDREEHGLKGSRIFADRYNKNSDSQRRVFLNVDSVGNGKLIQFLSSLPNVQEFPLPLPQLRPSGLRTDAVTLLKSGLRACSISSFDDNALDTPLPPHRITEIDSETFSRGNVCNRKEDTVDALDGPNMDAAVALIMNVIRGKTQKSMLVSE